MKKLPLLLSIALLSFLGCKDHAKNETTNEHATHATHHDNNALSNSWVKDIQLDNGTKWNANPETNEGVTNMLRLLENNTPTTLEDYHHLAKALNTEKNYIVKECTMKGASHDNLHVWLHPLIDKIGTLEASKTPEEAQPIYKSIKENITAYHTYFK
ncbi:hypothetical protein IA57_10990 [Mangrovimonas yunxiaonensis]|uniref:Superoxide dismutase n=1 Tax=Mangrovimonas yunxiaonensis TaxID=1197477 RepID=A0A084TJS4_9FLAO|nr:hypothetical protein [Mangrovimonas yunxiaonensis]KFB00960.1 hypothetical protein IA57_10990 [Mangrovimonas yunxiaonensis]GGH43365.1 hypothetical protein GCM10011364_15510 [Mangrovimonas yunxiaonensis]